jgi:hypothetical protein
MAARLSCWTLVLLIAALSVGSAETDSEPRRLSPSTIVMDDMAAIEYMERPLVEFDHAAHVDALKDEGCDGCHPMEDGELLPELASTHGVDGKNELIDSFHETCVGCHIERSKLARPAGPVTCGECHVRRPESVSDRAAISFDYSLHARHALAFPEKCEQCHHIWDEAQQKLVYVKGQEDACRSCHGVVDEKDTPSLENASHRDCISCHLSRREAELEAGPVHCVGCHDTEHQRSIQRLDDAEIPRLVRGQPDTLWIVDDAARTKVVAFDHKGHEPKTSSCSTCHHQSMKSCGECHSLLGSNEGGGVTMAQAYHRADSMYSCVGCHAREARQQECIGCHERTTSMPTERTCAVCHVGPLARPEVAEMPVPASVDVELAPLPPISDAYPETVEIDTLLDRYEATKLPHAKIVARLDAAVRDSGLARRFHGDAETLCAGCHHHAPAGARPAPCRACHGESSATRDMPDLKAAYHRQCMGCHAVMGIKAQKCTDCHEERGGADA